MAASQSFVEPELAATREEKKDHGRPVDVTDSSGSYRATPPNQMRADRATSNPTTTRIAGAQFESCLRIPGVPYCVLGNPVLA
mmetsp:Transcript_26284/g.55249  ORF Transcript_26284/g.55249 Transcript_26284/m.55249 type:complete len:83 (-) Transcript_26284:479-727(-)